jgi:hypothetical protein
MWTTLFEQAGGALVFLGVMGEVWTEVSEPEGQTIGEMSSMVLVIGLAFSLASMVGTDEPVSALTAAIIRGIR